MKPFNITIRAVVTKTLRVYAQSEKQATEAAHEAFSVLCTDKDEKYREEAIGVEKSEFQPWVVVMNPGQESEEILADKESFSEAQFFLKRFKEYKGAEIMVDIMKRSLDGKLTTEF